MRSPHRWIVVLACLAGCGKSPPPPPPLPPAPAPAAPQPAAPQPLPKKEIPVPDVAPAPVPVPSEAIRELAAAAAGKDKWRVAVLLSRDCRGYFEPFEDMRAGEDAWSQFFADYSTAKWVGETVDEDRATVRITLTRSSREVPEELLMVLEDGKWKIFER